MSQKPMTYQMWSLSELLGKDALAFDALQVSGATCDSRQVRAGMLFVALPGTVVDGAKFIPQAINNGATAVICQTGTNVPELPAEVAIIFHDNPRRLYTHLCAVMYPRQPATIAAVTGTNGKTSVVHFLRHIWQALGYHAASLGTLGIASRDGLLKSEGEQGTLPHTNEYDASILQGLTTADPMLIHKALDHLSDQGVTHLALEASSHGLDQYRLDEVRLRAAAITQMSRDHLDYHGSFEAYQAAKLRLFKECLPDDGVGVIHTGGAYAKGFKEASQQRGLRTLEVGKDGADLALRSVKREGFMQIATLEDALSTQYELKLDLVGEFQVENVLCAVGLALACERSFSVNSELIQTLLSAAESVTSVPGRMERMGDSAVFVDYAHTPDALEHALDELRPYTKGKLWVVFGCGGNRDAGKRSMMGKIACEKADEVVITDDNPRHEDAEAIRDGILVHCPQAKEIPDRLKAITFAYEQIKEGDVLLVAGKGHEDYQIIGDTKYPCDDRAHVLTLLKKS